MNTSDHVERGWGAAGQVFVSLPEETSIAPSVKSCERDVGDTGGPIQIDGGVQHLQAVRNSARCPTR